MLEGGQHIGLETSCTVSCLRARTCEGENGYNRKHNISGKPLGTDGEGTQAQLTLVILTCTVHVPYSFQAMHMANKTEPHKTLSRHSARLICGMFSRKASKAPSATAAVTVGKAPVSALDQAGLYNKAGRVRSKSRALSCAVAPETAAAATTDTAAAAPAVTAPAPATAAPSRPKQRGSARYHSGHKHGHRTAQMEGWLSTQHRHASSVGARGNWQRCHARLVGTSFEVSFRGHEGDDGYDSHSTSTAAYQDRAKVHTQTCTGHLFFHRCALPACCALPRLSARPCSTDLQSATLCLPVFAGCMGELCRGPLH